MERQGLCTSAAVSTRVGEKKFSYFLYLEKDLVKIVGLAKLTGEAARNVKEISLSCFCRLQVLA
jgi:hypothetical protein